MRYFLIQYHYLSDHVVMCDDCAKIIMDDTKKCPTCRAEAITVRRNTVHVLKKE